MSKTAFKTARPHRSGAAITELAICLPAIVVLILGAIECCTMIFVKQSLHVSAYEGIRLAIRSDGTDQQVLDRCNQVLQERAIDDPRIEITPSDVLNVARGTAVSVRVSAPCRDNSVFRPRFFTGSLSAEATMVKE